MERRPGAVLPLVEWLDTVLDWGVNYLRGSASILQGDLFLALRPNEAVDLRGKVAVVTGGSSGVGKQVCQWLAGHGAQVITGSRAPASAAQGIQQDLMKHSRKLGAGSIEMFPLDLADLPSVAAFAAAVRKRVTSSNSKEGGATAADGGGMDGTTAAAAAGARTAGSAAAAASGGGSGGGVDLLVLCAGIAGKPYKASPQGHEIQWATNYHGHFVLTQLLMDLLLAAKAPRVVVVTSHLHTLVHDASPGYTFSSLPIWGTAMGWIAYCRSKLAKTWFGYELQRRHPGLGVPLVHPGIIHSNITQVPTALLTYIKSWILATPEQGAQAVLYASTSPYATGHTYYHNVLGVTPSSKASYDPVSAAEHYELSMKIMERHLGKVEEVRAAATPAAGGILIVGV